MNATQDNRRRTAKLPVLGFRRAYAATHVPESPWTRLSDTFRKRMIYALWVPTWLILFAGLFDHRLWEVAIGFTALHALGFLALLRFRPLAFPAQLRIVYIGWLVLGTYVPALESMMYITTVGLGANLIWGYCPLARMMYLLPWNRAQPLSARVFVQAFLQPPRPGRFEVAPRRQSASLFSSSGCTS